MSIGNGIRVSLSMTLTDMVLPIETSMEQKDDTCASFQNPIRKNSTAISIEGIEAYDWDEYTQVIVLAIIYKLEVGRSAAI